MGGAGAYRVAGLLGPLVAAYLVRGGWGGLKYKQTLALGQLRL